MRRVSFSWTVIVLLVTSCATSITSTTPPKFYRAYTDADIAAPLRARVAKLETDCAVGAAPGPVVPPTYVEPPRPFSFELREGRQELSISVLALVDARGATVDCFVLDASDERVARESGAVMRAAHYRPARLNGVPVPSAVTVTIEGAGIPK